MCPGICNGMSSIRRGAPERQHSDAAFGRHFETPMILSWISGGKNQGWVCSVSAETSSEGLMRFSIPFFFSERRIVKIGQAFVLFCDDQIKLEQPEQLASSITFLNPDSSFCENNFSWHLAKWRRHHPFQDWSKPLGPKGGIVWTFITLSRQVRPSFGKAKALLGVWLCARKFHFLHLWTE